MSSIDERFMDFHTAHPEVYREFCRRAEEIRARGHKRYSADVILAIVRWHTDLGSKTPGTWKCNDHYTSRYARMLMRERPERFAGFFETRELRAAG
jgi:hypothetical protein